MNLKETPMYEGAHVFAEGGAVVCDARGNNRYILSHINPNGEVTRGKKDPMYHQKDMHDLGQGGVMANLGPPDGTKVLAPGEIEKVTLGGVNVRIEGTASHGIVFNGQRVPEYSLMLEGLTSGIRYPDMASAFSLTPTPRLTLQR